MVILPGRFYKRRLKLLIIFPLVYIILYYLLPLIIVNWYDYNFYSVPLNPNELFKIRDRIRNDDAPILTLVTSFKDVPQRKQINENTIKCWAALSGVIPVMYKESSDPPLLARLAESHGWQVYEAPALLQGYPVLKNMFLHALMYIKPKTFFVGYANSDILFTKGLVDTLMDLRSLNGSYLKEKGMFVTGTRINSLLHDLIFDKTNRLPPNMESQNPEEILRDEAYALDYFIFTRTQFPWSEVYDFVIGKPGYDNWLAIEVQKLGMITVDASLTIMAIHQTSQATHSDKGWLSKNVCMNRNLIEPFDFRPGRSYCMTYFTKRLPISREIIKPSNSTPKTVFSKVMLYQRNYFKYVCNPYFKQYTTCTAMAKKKSADSETYVINRFLVN